MPTEPVKHLLRVPRIETVQLKSLYKNANISSGAVLGV